MKYKYKCKYKYKYKYINTNTNAKLYKYTNKNTKIYEYAKIYKYECLEDVPAGLVVHLLAAVEHVHHDPDGPGGR